MLRRKFVTLASTVALVVPFISHALEPLEDRARLYSMTGELLLPDRSTLPFDMSFDCGSRWESTAMIVTSESGAKLLAEAYRAKWGEAAAKSILDSWYNKSHPDDPRKPSFLVVKVPSETQTQSKFKKQMRSVMSSSNESMSDMPVVEATCGTRSHHYR